MGKIKIDGTLISSAFPGFGYQGILTGSILVSGSVAPGGREYTTSVTVSSNNFIIGYYEVRGGGKRRRIGNLPTAPDIIGVGNNVYVFGNQDGTTYTVKISVDNMDTVTHQATTQTIDIIIYSFKSPFA